MGVSKRRGADGADRGDDPQRAGAVVRGHDHVGHRRASKYVFRTRSGNVFNPAALGVVAAFICSRPARAGGARPGNVAGLCRWRSSPPACSSPTASTRCRSCCRFSALLPALHGDVVFRATRQGIRNLSNARPSGGALFRLLHPHRSADVACEISGPDHVRRHWRRSSFAVFEWIGAAYYLLAGVLVGNIWEAWRRVHRRSGYEFPRGIGVFARISPWRVTVMSADREGPSE